MTTPHQIEKGDAGRIGHESLDDEYAWRFELIRSTLEDFDRLVEDEQPSAHTTRCSPSGPSATRRDIRVPCLTLPRFHPAAMPA